MGRRSCGCALLLAIVCLAAAPVRGASPPRGSRVSIYDGVLPSPDLGPRLPTLQAPVPAPAQAPESAPAAAPVEQPTPVPAPAQAREAAPAAAPVEQPTPEPLPAAVAANLNPSLPGAVPAPGPSPPSVVAIASASGLHCGAGCIAGATVGGVVLLILLPLLLWLGCRCCRHRPCPCVSKDDVLSTMSNADLDLLGHPTKPATEPRTGLLRVGDDVFLAEGRNCSFGRITAVLKDDCFQVATYTGESRVVEAALLARNFAEGTKVLYAPPAPGRATVTGTILQADGSYWPPFYQLTPDTGEVGLVNTTAQCLTELREDGMVEVCIDAKAA